MKSGKLSISTKDLVAEGHRHPIVVTAAVVIVVLIGIALVLWGASESNKAQVASLNSNIAALQAQVQNVTEQKTDVSAQLAQALSDKQAAISNSENANNALSQEKINELANARKIRLILSSNSVNQSLLNNTVDLYSQWYDYACNYYIGSTVLTNGGNVTVPLQCVLINGEYVDASKQLTDSLGTIDDRAQNALQELQTLYPALNSTT